MPRDAKGQKIPTVTERLAVDMIEHGKSGTNALEELANLVPELDSKKQALILVAKHRLKRREISEHLSTWIDGLERKITRASENGRPVIMSQGQASTLYNALAKAERLQTEDG